MDEITLTFRYADIPVEKISAALHKRVLGWGSFALNAASFVMSFGLVLFTFVYAETPDGFVMPESVLLFAAVIGMGLVFILQSRNIKKIGNATKAAPARLAESTVTLTPEGVTAPSALVAGRIIWDHVVGVDVIEGTLVLLLSPVEFIPLPEAGLPEGVSQEALIAQIEAWRS